MSKNTTQKGLAFGAGVALVSSMFAAAPANAAIEGFVTLAPSSGVQSAYAVIADTGNTFSIRATQGASAKFTGKELKFLVTDPEAEFVPAADGTSAFVNLDEDFTEADTMVIDKTANTVTITAADLATELGTGGYIFLDGALIGEEDGGAGATGATVASADTPYYATVDGNDITFKTEIDISGAGATFAVDQNEEVKTTVTVNQLSNLRGSNNSFVVDTGDDDAANADLKLLSPNTTTKSVTVQAFVDYVENDKIDSLDYVSPAREITFVALADLDGSIALTPPNTLDASLTATISTTPVINGVQVADDDLLAAVFTRQGSNQTPIVKADISTQDADAGTWEVSVSLADVTNLTGWVNATTDIAAIDLTATAGMNDWNFQLPVTPIAGTDGADAAAPGTDDLTAVSVATTGVVSVTTTAAHHLRTGDKITLAVDAADDVDSAVQATAVAVTVTGTNTFTYTLTATVKPTAAESDTDLQTATAYTVTYSSITSVFAGDYSATLAFEQTANKYATVGTASKFGTLALLAADTVITTVASESLQGASINNSVNNATDAKIKAGTLSATVTATVVDKDGVSVGAGRSVAYTTAVGANTTIKVNGLASSAAKPALVTDANGQVTFTVTDTTGTDGKTVTITVTPEGNAGAQTTFTLEWDTAALTLFDMNVSDSAALTTGTRTVAVGASYDLNLLVADQFFTAAADADYRLAVSGSGVTAGFVSLVNGKATVKVTDSQVTTSFVSRITLQKKGSTGVFANTTTIVDLTTATNAKSKVNLAADASTLYASSTADLSDAVAKVALVERDTRIAFAAAPLYVNSNLVSGKVTNTTSGSSVGFSVVTVSGPANILFSNGAVDKRGSITLVSDTNGEFAVNLYSTSAQTDSVITVTANGVSSTTKVSFTGIGVGEGTVLTVTTPAAVQPASTFQVKAKLSDAYGNGVALAAVKVAYTGAGIVFGNLPTATDANGELMFSVLLGSNDTGTVSVTVSYDQNKDADYLDAKDLVTTSTTVITASGDVASETKVNAGSFKGYVALYAKGYEGKKMSAIVAGKWIVVASLASDFERVVRFTGAGYDIVATIYIDGVMISTFNVTTK
ncbi:beta strand repeat-containing protein [Aquiluna sp. Uisw_065]|uniref:beta strand repeat-containing protein n=1 Tax=Aquiluna sp. Uisw_065 TaxID=3230967 RepID=UPI0039E84EC3